MTEPTEQKFDYVAVLNLAVKVAQFHRALYEAYVEQGFTDEQAMFLVAQQAKSMRQGEPG
jgi:hypothetical protein